MIKFAQGDQKADYSLQTEKRWDDLKVALLMEGTEVMVLKDEIQILLGDWSLILKPVDKYGGTWELR